MTQQEVLHELEHYGTAQNRKVYSRHGVQEPMFGVSFGNLRKLHRRIKVDHELALKLWQTENHDARVLATMIADTAQLTSDLLDRWVSDLRNYVLTDAFTAMASQTDLIKAKVEQWTPSKEEWTGQAGWQLLSHLAQQKNDLPDAYFQPFLKTIETDIHQRPNRVRHAMNMALIAIGIRSKNLTEQSLQVADEIGKVEVDHGQTSCTTPDATQYIHKTLEHQKKKEKRARA